MKIRLDRRRTSAKKKRERFSAEAETFANSLFFLLVRHHGRQTVRNITALVSRTNPEPTTHCLRIIYCPASHSPHASCAAKLHIIHHLTMCVPSIKAEEPQERVTDGRY